MLKIYSFIFFISILFIIGCGQKGVTGVDESLVNYLLGEWINTYTSYDNNNSNISLIFLNNNQFQITQEIPDENYIYISKGRYKILSNNLLCFYTYYQELNGEEIEEEAINDTIIFWYEDNQLEISAGTQSFIQLSGEKNTLINSTFYMVYEYDFNYYFHFKYNFYSDRLEIYYHFSEIKSIPLEWNESIEYQCEYSDKLIEINDNNDNSVAGYIFYKNKLYLGSGYSVFIKQ